jgi:hypothetical protein
MISQLLDKPKLIIETHFSWVEVFNWSGDMLCERKGVETFSYGSLNHFFKGVLRMAAELARVAVMGVWHDDKLRSWNVSNRSGALKVKVGRYIFFGLTCEGKPLANPVGVITRYLGEKALGSSSSE